MENRNTDNQGNLLKFLSSLVNDRKTDPIAEMKAYDRLGPETRRVIDEWPLPWSAELTLQNMQNPHNPQEDKAMAQKIAEFGKTAYAALKMENETMPIIVHR